MGRHKRRDEREDVGVGEPLDGAELRDDSVRLPVVECDWARRARVAIRRPDLVEHGAHARTMHVRDAVMAHNHRVDQGSVGLEQRMDWLGRAAKGGSAGRVRALSRERRRAGQRTPTRSPPDWNRSADRQTMNAKRRRDQDDHVTSRH